MSNQPPSASVPVPATPAPAAPVIARPIMSPKDMIQAHKDVITFVDEALEENVDFGVIPGTDKAALLQPGAQRLCIGFGLRPVFESIDSEIDHDREVHWSKKRKTGWDEKKRRAIFEHEQGSSLGLYRHVVRCRLVRSDGAVVGEALGSCSTMEGKYVDRPRECENTVLKMAQKRAEIGAVVSALGLSNRFVTAEEAAKKKAKSTPPVPPDLKVYEDTPTQAVRFEGYLKKAGVPEHLWPAIRKDMKGKTEDVTDDIVRQHWAGEASA